MPDMAGSPGNSSGLPLARRCTSILRCGSDLKPSTTTRSTRDSFANSSGSRGSGAPLNLQWGHDNRTAGLRVPPSDVANRRVENRIPSSDANPYLAIAASLAAGYLGMTQKLAPTAPIEHDANSLGIDLPRSLMEALALFEACEPLAELLGPTFVAAYTRVKQEEHETFMQTISAWEREFLLLNV